MPIYRSTKEELFYRKHLKEIDRSICQFCAVKHDSPDLIRQTEGFKIIKNIFPYSTWDMQKVTGHLMIVPIKHTESLKDLSDKEAVEFVKLISHYEDRGYNVYARAPGSTVKTVSHQHTHLIKTEGPVKSLLFWMYKPFYVRFLK